MSAGKQAEQPQDDKAVGGRQDRHRRALIGTVVSNKMDKTVVVQVSRRFKHPRYKKYVNERIRYKAHDPTNDAQIGDRVRIVECRPLSRDKRWRVLRVLERATIV